jgi:hypothetical protein
MHLLSLDHAIPTATVSIGSSGVAAQLLCDSGNALSSEPQPRNIIPRNEQVERPAYTLFHVWSLWHVRVSVKLRGWTMLVEDVCGWRRKIVLAFRLDTTPAQGR